MSQVQGKAALICANIKRTSARRESPRPILCSLVVYVLVEECTRFLTGIGIKVKRQPVQPELRGGSRILRISGVERLQRRRAQALQFANARVRTFSTCMRPVPHQQTAFIVRSSSLAALSARLACRGGGLAGFHDLFETPQILVDLLTR